MLLLSSGEPLKAETKSTTGERVESHGSMKGEMGQWAIIFIVGVGLVMLSFIFDQLWHTSEEASPRHWGHFFLATVLPYGTEHLGVVLVVASFLGVGVERAREKHVLDAIDGSLEEARGKILAILDPVQKQVAKLQEELGLAIRNVKILDQESITELTDKVLAPKFLRSEYVLKIHLQPYPADVSPIEFVKVSIDSSYVVKNIKEEPLPYTIRGWIDAFEDDWLPNDFPKACFQKMIFGLKQIMRSRDLFVWNMSSLTRSLRTEVTLSDELVAANFKVSAREMHHHDGLITAGQTNPSVWEIQQVLLPHQGIEIWWSPPPN
jgi:hypothetical protein